MYFGKISEFKKEALDISGNLVVQERSTGYSEKFEGDIGGVGAGVFPHGRRRRPKKMIIADVPADGSRDVFIVRVGRGWLQAGR